MHGSTCRYGSLVRPPALAVVPQDDVVHGLPSVIVLRVTLMSPSSPVCGWAGLPQPRSSRMSMARKRALGGASALRIMAASERTASPV